MGLAGIATAGVLTGALYGLFAAAQSAAGFKDGVVSLEGDGTETSDSIPAWLSKGESVITARATKNNVDELKWMNLLVMLMLNKAKKILQVLIILY